MALRWRIYSDEFKAIHALLPSKEEQGKIIALLEEKLKNIDKLAEKTKIQIEKLKSVKQSLISKTVTGKIEVLG